MSTEIILALIGLASSTLSGSLGWMLGKRKQNAEASLLEANSLETTRQLYESIIKDMQSKLAYYIELSESNRKEIHMLRRLVDSLIDDACLKKGCSMRVYYDPEAINSIVSDIDNLKVNEDGNLTKKE